MATDIERRRLARPLNGVLECIAVRHQRRRGQNPVPVRFDDPDRPVPWQGFSTKGPTRIGDNVWLGANVVVTSGVTIGERSVIGANSVVTHDIPPFSIATGSPAKVLRGVTYATGVEPAVQAAAAPVAPDEPERL